MPKIETQNVTGKVMMELSEQEAKIIRNLRVIKTDIAEIYIENFVPKWKEREN
jgi:hypothetical protein